MRYIDADALIEVLQEWRHTSSLNDGEGNPVDSILYDVIRRIEDAPTADVAPRAEWITVENPPEEYIDEYGELIPFLVCCKGTVYPFRAMYDGTNWGDGIGVLNVTHWMPLPEPPKGE
jgi:hypothetical protein